MSESNSGVKLPLLKKYSKKSSPKKQPKHTDDRPEASSNRTSRDLSPFKRDQMNRTFQAQSKENQLHHMPPNLKDRALRKLSPRLTKMEKLERMNSAYKKRDQAEKGGVGSNSLLAVSENPELTN